MNCYLFIKLYVRLHVSSLKCSSSGGHTVYMQHMVLSLSTRIRGGLSVHSVHAVTNKAKLSVSTKVLT